MTRIKKQTRVARESIAIVVINQASFDYALKLFNQFPNSRLFVPKSGHLNDKRGIYHYDEALKSVVRIVFNSYPGLIFLGSVGIAVRLVTPHLNDKVSDPGVVVVDQEGNYAVSLLSGHLGGGNELAQAVGDALQAQPIVTTASDLKKRLTPDSLAYCWNMTIEGLASDPRVKKLLKHINRDLVKGTPVNWLIDEKIAIPEDVRTENLWRDYTTPEKRCPFYQQAGMEKFFQGEYDLPAFTLWRHAEDQPLEQTINRSLSPDNGKSNGNQEGSVFSVLITDKCLKQALPTINSETNYETGYENFLVLRPKTLVVGIGCKAGTTAEAILTFIHDVVVEKGLSPLSVRELVSVEQKRSEPGLREAARYLNIPINFFSPQALKNYVGEAQCSGFVKQEIGVGNVCEAAVRARCGQDHMIQRKTINSDHNITLALGRVGWPQWALVPAVE